MSVEVLVRQTGDFIERVEIVRGEAYTVDDGMLQVLDDSKTPIVAYPAGHWVEVYVKSEYESEHTRRLE